MDCLCVDVWFCARRGGGKVRRGPRSGKKLEERGNGVGHTLEGDAIYKS